VTPTSAAEDAETAAPAAPTRGVAAVGLESAAVAAAVVWEARGARVRRNDIGGVAATDVTAAAKPFVVRTSRTDVGVLLLELIHRGAEIHHPQRVQAAVGLGADHTSNTGTRF
jgi:hypothetical protein